MNVGGGEGGWCLERSDKIIENVCYYSAMT